ncbi:MAG: hypothetical protein WCX32_03660 [Clostridia bacterium]|nr:hypothetical protein [Clostridia bacterium]
MQDSNYNDEVDLSSGGNIEKLAQAYKNDLNNKTVSTQENSNVCVTENLRLTQKVIIDNILINLHKQSKIYEFLKKCSPSITQDIVLNALIEKTGNNIKSSSIVCCEITGTVIEEKQSETINLPNYCEAIKIAQNTEAILIEHLFNLYTKTDNKIAKAQLSSVLKERLESIRLLTMLYGNCKHRNYNS